MRTSDIILVGGGGHCRSCIEVIEQTSRYRIVGIVDLPEKIHEKVLGYEIIAADLDLPRLRKECPNFLLTIGQITNPEKRLRLFRMLQDMKANFPVIISPTATVSSHAAIDEGTIVMHHAMVNAGARIGANCIINTGAIVEHDAHVDDHCHVSTGAILNGGVVVGQKTFIGSGVVVYNHIRIGEKVIIGANAVVPADVPDNHRLT